MNSTRPVPLRHLRLTSGFWKKWQDLVVERVVPYQWKALNDEVPGAEPSHSIENFRIAAGETQGEFYGLVFQDSDVGKWIEAAAYSLLLHPDAELEANIDKTVEVVAHAQEPDGYLQTYFSVKAPGKRWTDFAMGHEMYCGGHLIEGAVAYYQATGKTAFLDVMRRYADHLDATFGPGKRIAYCGHPEIELALYRLYEATGEERYRALARFFVDERGKHPGVLDPKKIIAWPQEPNKWNAPDYYQDHEPLRDQRVAVGHAVRAMYIYSAMADQWRLDQDATLSPALEALWKSVTEHRMYVTGGLGSHAWGERFSVDDDLPSDTAYTETCAAIGLVLWAWRLTLADPDSRYADVLERVLYNGALSGISLDGTRYFYVNPLEATPLVDHYRRDHDHVKTQRVEWFGCACCPPNIARTIASVAQYQYSVSEDGIWAHQFAEGRAAIAFRGREVVLEQKTEYPWEGRVTFVWSAVSESAGSWRFRVRIPDWSGEAQAALNGQPLALETREKGYAVFDRVWKTGDTLSLDFPMEVRFLYGNPKVAETAGKVAVQRGPFVYCAEEADNGKGLHRFVLSPSLGARVEVAEGLGSASRRIKVRALKTEADNAEALYTTQKPQVQESEVVLIPYHLWGNRGEGEMRVWLRSHE